MAFAAAVDDGEGGEDGDEDVAADYYSDVDDDSEASVHVDLPVMFDVQPLTFQYGTVECDQFPVRLPSLAPSMASMVDETQDRYDVRWQYAAVCADGMMMPGPLLNLAPITIHYCRFTQKQTPIYRNVPSMGFIL